jgi:IclR family transcriptional regulator, KDG regulon repressor
MDRVSTRGAESESQVRTLARALAILEQFTLRSPELTLGEISTGANLSKSTTHRLLSTLESAGLLSLDRRTGQYSLGLKAYLMGTVVSETLPLLKEAGLLLDTLARDTEESALLLVLDGTKAVCLCRFDGERTSPLIVVDSGSRTPLNCGSAQRVLLANLAEPRWESVVGGHVRQSTQYSLVDRADLERDREDIRRRGYCVAWEDVSPQVCGIGVPVSDASGAVIAAIAVAGAVQDFSPVRLPGLIRTVLDVGNGLSRRLGWTG